MPGMFINIILIVMLGLSFNLVLHLKKKKKQVIFIPIILLILAIVLGIIFDAKFGRYLVLSILLFFTSISSFNDFLEYIPYILYDWLWLEFFVALIASLWVFKEDENKEIVKKENSTF